MKLRFAFYVALAKVSFILQTPLIAVQQWSTNRLLNFYSPEERERMKQYAIAQASRKMG